MVHVAAQTGYSNEAGTYARGRPDYPLALSDWLAADLGLGPGAQVADVGAGTGKFTPLLLATGADVVAIEPVEAMRARIAPHERLRVHAGTAETTGLADGSFDAIVCAQAFHWFDSRAAMDEFARVLEPGGRMGLVWNVRDESVDWVAALSRIIAPHEGDAPRYCKQQWRAAFVHAAFGPLRETVYAHAHVGPPDRVIVDRIMSVSFIAALSDAERAAVRAQVDDLIASHPALRGQSVLRFPYQTRAFLAVRH